MKRISMNAKCIIAVISAVFLFGLALTIFHSNNVLQASVKNEYSIGQKPVVANNNLNLKNEYKDNYLIVYDPQNEQSIKEKDNVEQTLVYMKKSFKQCTVDQEADFANYTGVILTFSDLDRYGSLDALVTWVGNGGAAFFTNYLENNASYYKIYRKIGVNEFGEYHTVNGIKITDNILIKGENLTIKDSFIQNYLAYVSLDSQCAVHAQTLDSKPVFWSRQYGSGTFVVFNGTFLSSKEARGLITGGLSLMSKLYIYPIMNFKLMYIDDFPAPIPDGYNSTLKEEYNCDIKGFYRDIWWPDMLKAAKSCNLVYNGMIIETYNNQVDGPFSGRDDQIGNLSFYGRELLAQGGELGLHGYNHQPLALNGFLKETDLGYVPWNSSADMMAAVKHLQSYVKTIFPNYDFRVYVPPSNVMSSDGRAALLRADPDIKVLSSTYNEDITGDQYVQEFSISPDGILEMPRISSGYEYTDENKWDICSSISSVGVFSHFVHPDDVLDHIRSENKNWEQLYGSYNNMLKDVTRNYSWLKSQTVSQASQTMETYLKANNSYTYVNGVLTGYCNCFSGSMSCIVRSGSKVTADQNCTVREIDKNIYLITAARNNFKVSVS